MGDVALHEHLARARCDDVRIVAPRMAVGGHRSNAGDDLLARLVGLHTLQDVADHDLTDVLEHGLHAALRRPAHFAVVHEELVLGRRHQDLRVREGERLVRPQQTIDEIAVIVRDDHGIDGVAVDARGREIALELPGRSLAALEIRFARAGIYDDELRSRIHHHGIVRRRHHVLFIIGRRERSVHLLALLVGDVVVVEFELVGAIGHDGDFDVADLVAVPARRLGAGGRRRGGRGRAGDERSGGGSGGTGQQSASCKLGHGSLQGQSIFGSEHRIPRDRHQAIAASYFST